MQPEALPPKERALLDAARANDLAKVKEMLSQGAVVDARDNLEMPWGQTSLMYAAENGNEDMVRLLIHYGADIMAKDEAPPGEGGGQQPLHYAMRSKNVAVAAILLDAARKLDAKILDRPDKFGNMPLNVAIDCGNRDGIQLLLQRGLDLKKKPKTKRFEPPLFASVRNGSLEITELLLESGADVNAANELGQIPLHCAASLKTEVADRLIEILLRAGANCEHADNAGDTPLLNGLLHKNCTAVKKLSFAGANINRVFQDQDGTLLDLAEKRMNKAKKTLESPSEPEWARKESQTSYSEWKGLVDLLLELGAKRKAEIS